ncbi:Tubulin--tyrosine ligase-like protein [Actinidia chinensis var. chinensis]|uniref:Tubulin--tyrosine ligase-like protein n=1 Tax=Actinidia chinensis var. chinensis TaxID=1590841 RepID=A0A2R6R423_ACTCC|nr:Tubulin--tyrosine ligase-like protein [Actinidia chinensis var. chinensis]
MASESDVFLVDHAWTFRLSDARKQVDEVPGLAERMASMMCVDIDLNSDAEDMDNSGGGLDENSSKLNVLEIVECEIRKAKEKGEASVRWLEREELDMDDSMMLSLDLPSKFPAFSPAEMPSLSHPNLQENPLEQNSVVELLKLLKGFACLNALGHVIDSMLQPRLPEWTSEEPLADRVINAVWLYLMTYRLADEGKIDETSVWYVMDELGSALRHSDEPNFRVSPFLYMPDATDPKDADIIWTVMQVDEDMKAAAGLTDQQYINQFPFEACLVIKHHLAETVQKFLIAHLFSYDTAHGSPAWFQPTYNLETQLTHLIGDYNVRKRDGLDNLGILKPWNMAQTIDTTITDNLSGIIRLMETGPKICQKYIEHPALFKGKKFGIRYVVLVCSMDPLEIFVCGVLGVRLANNQYSFDKHSFSEYETHFTVMFSWYGLLVWYQTLGIELRLHTVLVFGGCEKGRATVVYPMALGQGRKD